MGFKSIFEHAVFHSGQIKNILPKFCCNGIRHFCSVFWFTIGYNMRIAVLLLDFALIIVSISLNKNAGRIANLIPSIQRNHRDLNWHEQQIRRIRLNEEKILRQLCGYTLNKTDVSLIRNNKWNKGRLRQKDSANAQSCVNYCFWLILFSFFGQTDNINTLHESPVGNPENRSSFVWTNSDI